jgi:malonyl-CoA O-methyltransferase
MNEAYRIKQCFNKASQTYDHASVLQQTIGEKLIGLIREQISNADNIIDLGCGTGIVTKKLALTLTPKHLCILDLAEQLLSKAKQHLSSFQPHTHEGDFNEITKLNQHFNLVFSNMALQWSINLTNTMEAMHQKLAKQGLIAFSIPLSGTLHELKYHYNVNSFFTSETIKEKLMLAQLEIVAQQKESMTLSFESLFAALQSIKQVGANYTGKRIHKGLRGKSFLSLRMLQPLTYVIGYFIAKKSSP